jgi:hypothetical protein
MDLRNSNADLRNSYEIERNNYCDLKVTESKMTEKEIEAEKLI